MFTSYLENTYFGSKHAYSDTHKYTNAHTYTCTQAHHAMSKIGNTSVSREIEILTLIAGVVLSGVRLKQVISSGQLEGLQEIKMASKCRLS